MTTMTPAYRDSTEGAAIRYAQLLDSTRADTDIPAVARVFGARAGRVGVGVAGIVGAGALALATLSNAAGPSASSKLSLTGILLASWPVMGVAYLLGRAVGAYRMAGVTTPRRTGDVHGDLARLEQEDPGAEARRVATRLERASIGLPMVAMALLAPLTLHYGVYALFDKHADFDGWVAMSLVIVGHAHLVLAALYWRFADKASRQSVEEIALAGTRPGWRVLGITVGLSAVPGALLLLIPPVLTAATGVLFNPLLFHWMVSKLVAERRVLG